MPELPDLIAYREALESRIVGKAMHGLRIHSPSLLRSVEPPVHSLLHRVIRTITLLGKRIVLGLDDEFFLVLHLMISGRLHWKPPGLRLRSRADSAAIDVTDGTLLITEASTKKRASLHIVCGTHALGQFDRGGIDPLRAPLNEFRMAITRERHTLKRALIDPAIISGIGNAYSDEILHRARLSPLRQSAALTDDELRRLYGAVRVVLEEWIERLRKERGTEFPEKVTAFREGMAVHGRFGKACPVCASQVQRIVYASNECNYCPRCQTGGRLLSDRSLARLLKEDWPKTIEELEAREHQARHRSGPFSR